MGDLWGYITGLAFLLVLSGFFSGSEAAFFSLTPSQRRQLSKGLPPDRLASNLLSRSERLLMGILFWNLAINLTYFALVSQATLKSSTSAAPFVTIGSLLAIIVGGEFLPKSLAVLYPITAVRTFVVPLALAIRLVDPLLPIFRWFNEYSRRLIWPGFKSEPYLEIADLQRAVELSKEDEELFEQESQVLRNVLQLSEIRVEEWMRPRIEHLSFTPPLSLKQLQGKTTPSGYILVTDAAGQDIVSAVDLSKITLQNSQDLQQLARPLVVVPWCASIADALSQLLEEGGRVAVVVNELGESIGILTWEQILDAVLQTGQIPEVRTQRLHLRQDGSGRWRAAGTVKLRKLERALDRRLEVGSALTVGGVMQEQLLRIPEVGDICQFADMTFEVVEAEEHGDIVVQITLAEAFDSAPTEELE